jgi:hypothetical protein
VQQPDPLDPLKARVGRAWPTAVGVPQRGRDRFAEAGRPVQADNSVRPDQLGEHCPAAVPASRVHPDNPVGLVRLSLDGLDCRGQQASAVMRDDDRGDGVPGLRCSR